MTAELISVGTELLLGNIVNTNAAYLSERMAALGFSVYFETTVGDNQERLSLALETALSRSDVVLLSGGLGPTEDDITRETTARVLNLVCTEDQRVKEAITQYFSRRKQTEITQNNWKQAMVPEGAQILFNSNGTAPGLILKTRDGKRHIILLPGPPGELIPLFEEQVAPYLKHISSSVICSRTVKISGLGESMVEDRIRDLMDRQTNPTIAPYAKTGEVHLRVTAQAYNEAEAEELVQPICDEIAERFPDHVYSMNEKETLEDHIIELLEQYGLSLTTAESCTGGMLAGRIVNVAGVSQVFRQGFITYSNEAKRELLGVGASTLQNHGAVSKETAAEMAIGAAKAAGADAALAITGIAGPDGGTKEKPVGLVYIGCYLCGKLYVREHIFYGNRQKIRENSVAYALSLLWQSILEQERNELLKLPE